MAEGQSAEIEPVRGIPPGAETVFLVHGHNGAAKHEVARFVERITGKPPVILDEQANRGRTLVEKFETHATTAAYAIVLVTPDDVGRVNGTDPATDQPRARQNVVFELGYFFGKLGRDRVAVLNSGVEKPSDVDGLAYIGYPAGNWQVELAKELHAAGVPVDMTRLL
jgi:predicted nucleotide-binding protein